MPLSPRRRAEKQLTQESPGEDQCPGRRVQSLWLQQLQDSSLLLSLLARGPDPLPTVGSDRSLSMLDSLATVFLSHCSLLLPPSSSSPQPLFPELPQKGNALGQRKRKRERRQPKVITSHLEKYFALC